MKILMLCLGNICRSPLAEGIMAEKIKQNSLNWLVDSAGTYSFHVGEPPHILSQKVAFENKIDISHQRCRRFKIEDFDKFDIIYAMAADVIDELKNLTGKNYRGEKVKLILNELPNKQNEDVPDPYYSDYSAYQKVYRLLDEVIDEIVRKYTQSK